MKVRNQRRGRRFALLTGTAIALGLGLGAAPATASTPQALAAQTNNDGEYHSVSSPRRIQRWIGPNQTVRIPLAEFGGYPSARQMSAAVYNLTAHRGTANTYLTTFPSGIGRPNTSSLNIVAGQAQANQTTTRVGSDGSINVYNAFGTILVLIDPVGWYSSSAGPNGMHMADQSESHRILDTGPGGTRPGAVTTIDVSRLRTYTCPSRAPEATTLTLTVAGASRDGWLVVWPSNRREPTNNSSLNFGPARQASANTITVDTYRSKRIHVKNESGAPIRLIANYQGGYNYNRAGCSFGARQGRYAPLDAPQRYVESTFNVNRLVGDNLWRGDKGLNVSPSNPPWLLDTNVTTYGATGSGYLTRGVDGPASFANFQPGPPVAASQKLQLDSAGNTYLSAFSPRRSQVRYIVDLVGYFY